MQSKSIPFTFMFETRASFALVSDLHNLVNCVANVIQKRIFHFFAPIIQFVKNSHAIVRIISNSTLTRNYPCSKLPSFYHCNRVYLTCLIIRWIPSVHSPETNFT